jgi:four helix bundle protein
VPSAIILQNFYYLYTLSAKLFINQHRCIMSNFENLKVWHKAIELAVSVYRITADNPFFQKDYSLRDQLRRASVSISSNISEGDQLGSDRQAIRQFYIAKGSAAELFTQITISIKIGYLIDSESDFLIGECKSISAMLTNLIKARR